MEDICEISQLLIFRQIIPIIIDNCTPASKKGTMCGHDSDILYDNFCVVADADNILCICMAATLRSEYHGSFSADPGNEFCIPGVL